MLDSGDGPPDLVLGMVERSERARLIISIGEFNGQLRVGVRQWRLTAKSGAEFRPTPKGVSLLAAELDAVIAALERARGLIAEHRPGALDGPAGEGGGHGG